MNTSASKHTLTKRVREGFPEWDQYACNVRTHKSWATVCSYLLKEDKSPLVVGKEYCLKQLKEIAEAKKSHRKRGASGTQMARSDYNGRGSETTGTTFLPYLESHLLYDWRWGHSSPIGQGAILSFFSAFPSPEEGRPLILCIDIFIPHWVISSSPLCYILNILC